MHPANEPITAEFAEVGREWTARLRAREAVAVEQLGRPEWIYTSCRIPFSVADSLVVSGPKFVTGHPLGRALGGV